MRPRSTPNGSNPIRSRGSHGGGTGGCSPHLVGSSAGRNHTSVARSPARHTFVDFSNSASSATPIQRVGSIEMGGGIPRRPPASAIARDEHWGGRIHRRQRRTYDWGCHEGERCFLFGGYILKTIHMTNLSDIDHQFGIFMFSLLFINHGIPQPHFSQPLSSLSLALGDEGP